MGEEQQFRLVEVVEVPEFLLDSEVEVQQILFVTRLEVAGEQVLLSVLNSVVAPLDL